MFAYRESMGYPFYGIISSLQGFISMERKVPSIPLDFDFIELVRRASLVRKGLLDDLELK